MQKLILLCSCVGLESGALSRTYGFIIREVNQERRCPYTSAKTPQRTNERDVSMPQFMAHVFLWPIYSLAHVFETERRVVHHDRQGGRIEHLQSLDNVAVAEARQCTDQVATISG